MYESEQPLVTRYRIMRWVIVALLAALIGYGVWFSLTHGALRVSSSSKTAQITVTLSSDTNKVEASNKSGSLFTILQNGTYIVTVIDGQKQQKTLVTVSSFSTKEVTLNPPQILGTEPVTNLEGPALAASANSLSLFDIDAANIATIGQDNNYSITDNTYQFDSASWVSASNGYASAIRTVDRQKVFLQIVNGSPSELALPVPFTDQTYLAYNTSPTGELYVIVDGTLSKRSNDGTYTRIVDTNKQALIRSVSSKYASLLYRNAEEECEYQFISLEKKTIKKKPVACVQSPDYGYSASWSADEKFLALTTGTALTIYDQNFAQQYTIPDPTAAHPVWLSKTELAYVSANNVWKYNLETKTSSVVSTTPQYVSIQNMKKADDSDTLYFVGRADDQLSLYRTTAFSDKITPIQKLAESNMKELEFFCKIHYINFISLKIIALTSPAQQGECTSLITDYLSSISVPIPPIQYTLDEEFGYLD